MFGTLELLDLAYFTTSNDKSFILIKVTCSTSLDESVPP